MKWLAFGLLALGALILTRLHAQTAGQTAQFTDPTHAAGIANTGTGLYVLQTGPTIINPTFSGTVTGATTTIASGTLALGTSSISSATCATAVTGTATGTATSDVMLWSFSGDPTAVTGYIPATAGTLAIFAYPSLNTVNVRVC